MRYFIAPLAAVLFLNFELIIRVLLRLKMSNDKWFRRLDYAQGSILAAILVSVIIALVS